MAFLQDEATTFLDAHETIDDLIAEDDRGAVRHTFPGTQKGPLGSFPPTGRTMEATRLAIYRIESGRIAEAWAEWDTQFGLKQLGHLDAER